VTEARGTNGGTVYARHKRINLVKAGDSGFPDATTDSECGAVHSPVSASQQYYCLSWCANSPRVARIFCPVPAGFALGLFILN
jgi:hypothetical protein